MHLLSAMLAFEAERHAKNNILASHIKFKGLLSNLALALMLVGHLQLTSELGVHKHVHTLGRISRIVPGLGWRNGNKTLEHNSQLS